MIDWELYKDGLVYGATSVFGGLGIQPSEEEAKLFIFDPEKKEVVYEIGQSA